MLARIGRNALRLYTAIALLYLLLPIAIVALFSFNDPSGKTNYSWVGFTLAHWGHVFSIPGLGDAVLDVPITAREYEDAASRDEQMTTPYLADGTLDVSGWARDAVALALPDKILCRPDCAGLCPVCGKNRNRETCACESTWVDPRFEALRELKKQL